MKSLYFCSFSNSVVMYWFSFSPFNMPFDNKAKFKAFSAMLDEPSQVNAGIERLLTVQMPWTLVHDITCPAAINFGSPIKYI